MLNVRLSDQDLKQKSVPGCKNAVRAKQALKYGIRTYLQQNNAILQALEGVQTGV